MKNHNKSILSAGRENTMEKVITDLSGHLGKKPGKTWFWAMLVSLIAAAAGVVSTVYTIREGLGGWGLNNTINWGTSIAAFVWWIGIGHAGTFISAILLLFQQEWRNSINRAAEAMTIFAIICAAFFPIIHMGRPFLAFFTFPYPNTRNLWVNFNSPLLWDVFAISTYFTVSVIFLFLGLLPDINLLKSRLKNNLLKKFYRILSVKTIRTKHEWKTYKKLMLFLAGIATPLVLSVHSIVSMDFATSIVPGWHSTIFPPFFVAGAIFSGFAAVQLLVIITRKTMQLENYITLTHIEKMNKIILLTGSIVAMAYGIELYMDLHSGKETLEHLAFQKIHGKYALLWWAMLCCNVVLPQFLWSPKIRRNIKFTIIVSICILFGMWLERYLIVVPSLETSYIPARWNQYTPSITEAGLFIGTIGLFLTLFLLFIRVFLVVSIIENLPKSKSDEQ